MKYTHIVWDFNGTLLDDVDTGIRSVNTLLSRRGLPTLESREQYLKVFGFPVKDYYARLGFDFEKESFDKIAAEWVEQYMKNVRSAHLRQGAEEMLRYFRDRNVKQYILSMTELNMLRGQTEQLNIGKYFDKLYGLDNIYAYGKLELARICRSGFDRNSKILLIGDTCHDCETAGVLGADCVLVYGGHESRESLLLSGATVIDCILQLRKIVNENI